MKEVHIFCPQCGKEDAYFEPEEGDYTVHTPFYYIQWKCPNCGYPDVIWDRYFNSILMSKTYFHFKIIDENGNIIEEWNG